MNPAAAPCLFLFLLWTLPLRAESMGVPKGPVPTPSVYMTDKEYEENYRVDGCYVEVDAQVLQGDRNCQKHPQEKCNALNETCRWKTNEAKCRGKIYFLCATGLNKRCQNRFQLVEKIPAGKTSTVERFRCSINPPGEVRPYTDPPLWGK